MIQHELFSTGNGWKHLNSEMYEIIEREITVIEETLIPKSLNFQDPSANRQQDAMKNLCYDMTQKNLTTRALRCPKGTNYEITS